MLRFFQRLFAPRECPNCLAWREAFNDSQRRVDSLVTAIANRAEISVIMPESSPRELLPSSGWFDKKPRPNLGSEMRVELQTGGKS